MYFHVIINPLYGQVAMGGFVPNLQESQLEERILRPYRQGRSIAVSGVTIPSRDIGRIRILETKEELGQQHFRDVSMSPDPFEEYTSAELNERLRLLSEMGRDVTDALITGRAGDNQQATGESPPPRSPAADVQKVFVVHGRNAQAREALFTFLRSIGLHPVEWSEAVQATGKPLPYVDEILNAAFSAARAVVVLLTPDDEARLKDSLSSANDPPHETQLTGQARPNVLFEAGMAMARSQDGTVLVELGSLRPFSDIAGRHTIRLDNSSQRRQELAQRLESAGCAVNLDGTDWHTAGDFDAVLNAVEALSETVENAGSAPDTSVVGQLSDEAKELLRYGAKDKDGAIHRTSTSGGVTIHVKSKVFNEPGIRRSEAKWDAVLDELVDRGLIDDQYGEGRYFEVTHEGFQVADQLGSTP